VDDLATQLRGRLKQYKGRSIALLGGNSLAWILCDLALLGLPVRVVPIPDFFSAEQIEHVFRQAEISMVLGMEADVARYGQPHSLLPALNVAGWERPVHNERQASDDLISPVTAYEKVTFTSGSTGAPKGVRLSLQALESTAVAVAEAMADLQIATHLSILPHATLLENVAGLYAPILRQVSIQLRPLAELGFNGASQFNVFAFMQQLQQVQPHACILVPQLLMALVVACEKGMPVPDHFRFIAVGGGKVSADLLQRAAALGLPVFEGYGLSECGSVVSLNRPGACHPGTVGKALSHVDISLSDDGEIMVSGNTMLGYLGEAPLSGAVATGDLGWRDEEGFIHISGRRKNMFITGYGRNVNPEWIEAELLAHPAIAQVAVFGEALPENVAIITPRAGFSWPDVMMAVAVANQRVPDYAQVGRLIQSEQPFSVGNQLATANGRNRRDAIQTHYFNKIHAGEIPMTFFDELTAQTQEARNYLLSAPVIEAVPQGRFDLESYQYFLTQAFHHVKHTVPLMMACGGRLPQDKEWVREALAEYIEDEYGHQEWILNDLAACGVDKEAVRHGRPHIAIELMVAFLYDQIERQNPMAFFGMVMVLEGTSIKLATQMGKIVQQTLDLPNQAFSYLYSHGDLDQDHFQFFQNLMNRITNESDQRAIIHSANVVYPLYGDMLRSIPLQQIKAELTHAAA